jgi:hypothetical protein
MLGYDYTDNMIREHLIKNAKGVGKLWASLILQYPTIYSDFWRGYYEEVKSRLSPKAAK